MEEVNSTKKVIILALVGLLLMSGALFKVSKKPKKENTALKLKLITLSKNKPAAPWQFLVKKTQNSNGIIQDEVTTVAAAILKTKSDERTLKDFSLEELASILDLRMKRVKLQNSTELNKNIAIAKEIIYKDPSAYSAYKALLISLLIEEGKMNHSIDETELNQTLEEMAKFNLNTDPVINQEEALVVREEEEVDIMMKRLNFILEKKDELESKLDFFDLDSDASVIKLLEMERQILASEERDTIRKITELSNNLNYRYPEKEYINPDIVQIPFLRMMAKHDYDGVISSAESFIEQFPDSIDGYFYLIKAYEAIGREEEAVNLMSRTSLPSDIQNILQKRLLLSSSQDPKNYWENLRF